jgi:hypothetical protein
MRLIGTQEMVITGRLANSPTFKNRVEAILKKTRIRNCSCLLPDRVEDSFSYVGSTEFNSLIFFVVTYH